KLPEIGRILGRGLREIKKAADEIKDQVSIDIGNIDEKDIRQDEIRVVREQGSSVGMGKQDGNDRVV
ncbi:MAG: twin-arginine translocase TatA/TatE family subunit, partial [Candidatus Desantisbacteria bacterium]